MYLYSKTKDDGISVYRVIPNNLAICNYKKNKMDEQIEKGNTIFIKFSTDNEELMKNFCKEDSLHKNYYHGIRFNQYKFPRLSDTEYDNKKELLLSYIHNLIDTDGLRSNIVYPKYKAVYSPENQLIGGLLINQDTYNFSEDSHYYINKMLYIPEELMLLHYLQTGKYSYLLDYDLPKELIELFDFKCLNSVGCDEVRELLYLRLLDPNVINKREAGDKLLKKIKKKLD